MNVSGSGASAFSGLSDVAISSPSTGQVPVYNSGTSKWENGPLSADEIAAAMAGEDLDLENLGLHGGYGNIAATIAQMLFDHSYNLGSYEFRCNSSRVGGFPLTPSDMPTQYALEAVASSQTLNTSDYKTILYDTPGVNTGPAWSYSSGTWTCLIAGVYDIDAIIYAASSVVVELYVNKNGTRRYGGSAVICSGAPSVRKTISFGSGDTFYIEAYAAGTGPALDVSIVGLRDIFVNRRA